MQAVQISGYVVQDEELYVSTIWGLLKLSYAQT